MYLYVVGPDVEDDDELLLELEQMMEPEAGKSYFAVEPSQF